MPLKNFYNCLGLIHILWIKSWKTDQHYFMSKPSSIETIDNTNIIINILHIKYLILENSLKLNSLIYLMKCKYFDILLRLIVKV